MHSHNILCQQQSGAAVPWKGRTQDTVTLAQCHSAGAEPKPVTPRCDPAMALGPLPENPIAAFLLSPVLQNEYSTIFISVQAIGQLGTSHSSRLKAPTSASSEGHTEIHSTSLQDLEEIICSYIHKPKHWREESSGAGQGHGAQVHGGVYGGSIKPIKPILCLMLKVLQVQPEKGITVEFLKNEDFKYVQMLGEVSMRLAGTAIDGCRFLEPLNSWRIKHQNRGM
ncbi:Pre-mRNA-splicing factor 38A [Lonchura striata]|uniref:Pre-mRNA-splicing factor 38B n=1 Tax=Lonchura striata TaxID=40157 RepID=A0A218VDF8_9PASE|nr:Pre-mRNA-splicing factor 38A [Lonchura striata domestica]